eukprot:350000-Chlamydomonas_euryale.AAC.3
MRSTTWSTRHHNAQHCGRLACPLATAGCQLTPQPVRVQLEAGITLYQVQVLFEAAHSELPGWPLPPPPPPLLPLPPNVSRPPPSTPAVHGGTGGSMAGAGRGGKFYEKLTSNSGWGVANRRLLRLDALGGGVRGSGSQPQHVAVGLAQTAAVADVRIRTPQQEPPPDFALVLELSLVVRRINSIRVFSIAIVTIMWLLSSFLLALTLDIMCVLESIAAFPRLPRFANRRLPWPAVAGTTSCACGR